MNIIEEYEEHEEEEVERNKKTTSKMLSICRRTEKLSLDSGPTHVDSMDVERLCSLQLLYLVVCWLFGCCVNAAKLRSYQIYYTLTCTHSFARSFSLFLPLSVSHSISICVYSLCPNVRANERTLKILTFYMHICTNIQFYYIEMFTRLLYRIRWCV